MAKPILKSQQSLVDAEKVIQLANDIVAGKIKNLDEIKDEKYEIEINAQTYEDIKEEII